MSTRKTELQSIRLLEERIAMSDYLDPYINSNDKEPSWDGFINVHSKAGYKKSDLIGHVPIQVKGSSNNNLPDKITHPVSINDMKCYLTDGGAMYFVVRISRSGPSKIYYAALTPVLLKLELATAKKSTKRIQFLELPADPRRVTEILWLFAKDCFKQKSFGEAKLDTLPELEEKGIVEAIETSFVFWGSLNEDPLLSLLNKPMHLYAKIKNAPIPHPIKDIFTFKSFSKKHSARVSINEHTYFNNFEVVKSHSTTTYKFGNSLSLEEKDGKTLMLNYEDSPILSSRIRDLRFFVHLCECKQLEIDGKPIQFDDNASLSGFDLEAAKDRLEYLTKISQFLDLMSVHDDIDLAELTARDWQNLSSLVQAFIDKEPIRGFNKKLPPIVSFGFLKYKFIVALHKLEDDDAYEMHDFFYYEAKVTAEDEFGNKHEIPPCSILSSDNLLRIANIRFDCMLPAFQKIDTPFVRSQANSMLLKLLHAYDMSSGKNAIILKTARAFAEWLHDHYSDALSPDTSKLNLLQTYKRERELTKDEMRELCNMISKPAQEVPVIVAANLLLDNQIAAEIYFEKLSDDDQNKFKKYPIYFYWEKASGDSH